ncbi:protocadherin beta-16-like isoform X13 [Syngnathoides biaculeatus]|uniref:protocadherin beta-16-like isoform X13 n=1 Tax=Syngnathoides biaculeatus TaxID=300417 RepID=UPI002ADE5395|nr:protocadherin beta-16-like isoform X13 [Syngnathoides biaculeatus]
MSRHALSFVCALCLAPVLGHVIYSIPEEMAKGSFIGNIAQDLALDLKRLQSGKARIHTGGSADYVQLDREKGVLLVKERIDREAVCGQTTPCALHFQIALEQPIEILPLTVEITDINDNDPVFEKEERMLEISESAVVGSKFMLEKAVDPDIGLNGLQSYTLKPNDNFMLKLHRQSDGGRKVEMILQKPLDREREELVTLLLTAQDGGEPQRSGTMQIQIKVLDVNDNAPVFTQNVYKASIKENSPSGTLITEVSASDADKGSNGEVSYAIGNSMSSISKLFHISHDGRFLLKGPIDYETAQKYEIDVEAVDRGGLSDSSKVIIEVGDVNDNSPVIKMISSSTSVEEGLPADTVIAVMSVNDPDSEENGRVTCVIDDHLPFKVTSTSSFYSIAADGDLDRERSSEYNISVMCSDEGAASLSSSVTLNLHISDVNDNVPVFERSSYEAHVAENNAAGLSVVTLKARDADWGQNARVSYFLEEEDVHGVAVSSLVSVHPESGVVRALRSFDYEQIQSFRFNVSARDSGSPPLSSAAAVHVLIRDQNDNAPQVLYPVQTGGSGPHAEMVPRSADAGYLVTKVVAVDVDSGQNAWLSYKVQQKSSPDRGALFEVGLHNGEMRTVHQVTDKDAVKQRLTVVVEDNGQPSRSATVVVNVALADGFPQVLRSEFADEDEREADERLTFYLVLALAVVSFLFVVCLLLIISVKVYRWRQSRVPYGSNLPVIPYYPPRYSDTLGTAGTLPHVYNYEACGTARSAKSAGGHNVLLVDATSTGTAHKLRSERNILDELDSPLEVRKSFCFEHTPQHKCTFKV